MDSKQIDVSPALKKWMDHITWYLFFYIIIIKPGPFIACMAIFGRVILTPRGLETSQGHLAN